MAGLWVPDNRLLRPRDSIPKIAVTGLPSIDRTCPITAGLIDVLIPRGYEFLSADDHTLYKSSSLGAFGPQVDVYGQSIRAPSATTASYRLSAANTASKFTRPSAAVTVMVVLKRLGDESGHSPIFACGSAITSPYAAWGVTDRTGLNILRFEFATGSGYHYIEQSGGFTGDVQCIIATYDGTTASLYSNGIRLTSASFSGSLVYPAAADAGPSIGNFFNYTGAARSFNGNIYMCALWDRALSPAEVALVSEFFYRLIAT
jgi:hypothetical protein